MSTQELRPAALRVRAPAVGADVRVGLVACVALCLALRGPFASVPLGIDEGGLAYVAGQWSPLHAGPSLYGAMWVDRPPLLLLLFKAADSLGVDGIRLLGALAAVAVVVLVEGVARRLGGARAGVLAAALAAVGASSVAIRSVATPGELLAAVPATGAIACVLACARTYEGRWLAVAGALAACAPLVKQSALDGGAAVVAFLVVAGARPAASGARAWWPLAAAAGAAVPLGACALWAQAAGPGVGPLLDALLGFRLDALGSLSSGAGSDAGVLGGLGALVGPAAGAGLLVVAPLAVLGLLRLRAPGGVAAALAAWGAVAALGVVLSGSAWPHYLVALVAPLSVLGGLGLDALARPAAAGLVTLVVAVSLLVSVGAVAQAEHRPPGAAPLAVARWLRAHAAPGDTLYVRYQRPEVLEATGMRTPFPYAWDLMVRARPGLVDDLTTLLATPRAPTWLVGWQPTNAWGVDRGGRLRAVTARRYARVAMVAGVPVLHLRPGGGAR